MRWPWASEPVREVNHTQPLADGDRYPVPGWPRWADLIDDDQPPASDGHASPWLAEPTSHLAVVPTAPLMMVAAIWRSRWSRS